MPQTQQRSKGRGKSYQIDRGGTPVEPGAHLCQVAYTHDPERSGRMKVVIISGNEGINLKDESLWRTVSYLSPFYGNTQQYGSDKGTGSFVGNKHSYGMWFTPPDVGTYVICIWIAGDPSGGYYLGSVPEAGINHMIPAIGADKKFVTDKNTSQNSFFSGAKQLPTAEFNDEDPALDENPRFFDQPKPVHSVIAGIMLQQGLIKDTIRGPITSSAQRESPSNAYGISTPGRPIWAGGMTDKDIAKKLAAGSVKPQDAIIVGRRGGHTFVMDDGDISGVDQLVRIRTATGHQIMMSDSGNTLHIIHANGQTWLEFGSEGTVDVYSSNSINLRSQGDINIHADRNININAGGKIGMYANSKMQIESNALTLTGKQQLLAYSQNYIGVKSDGSIALDSSKSGSWNGGSSLTFNAGCIALNSGGAPSVQPPPFMPRQKLNDVKFDANQGWTVNSGAIDTIVTRAPTHEPYPYKGKGTSAQTSLATSAPSSPSSSVSRALGSTSTNVTPVSTDTTTSPDQTDVPTPDTNTDPVTIDEGDYIAADPPTPTIGSVLPEEVVALFAVAIKESGQTYNEIGPNGELGQFGFTPQQLEDAGYLKPGTIEFYLSDGKSTTQQVLEAPSVWTGRDGVSNLAVLLTSRQLQNNIQVTLYQQSLAKMVSLGIITGYEDASIVGPMIQVATKYGITATQAWLNEGYVANLNDIKNTARSTQYGVQLVQQKLNNAALGIGDEGEGTTNTTQRTAVDAAVSSIVGNQKVEIPGYTNGS